MPRPEPHEVLIAVHTAGIGSWDAAIRDGSWRKRGRPRFPLVPGVDGSGVVVAKGARVRRVHVGDRVYAYEFGNRQGGFYAEFAAAHAEHVGRVPKGLDLREAGAVAATGLTALQGIDALKLRPGQTVLIFGASGAVGTMAVQFAVQRGAQVIASASGAAATRLVRKLGAHRVIDARRASSMEQLRKFAPDGLDGVLALAGGDELERELGSDYAIRYPQMPDEAEPKYAAWKATLKREFAKLDDGAILVGHSIGGTILIRTLADDPPKLTFGGLFLIAAPFVGKSGWHSVDIQPLSDLGATLRKETPVYLYHGSKDHTAPFEHVYLYAKAMPRAVVRRLSGRDHQLNNDMSEVATDIRRLGIVRVPRVSQ